MTIADERNAIAARFSAAAATYHAAAAVQGAVAERLSAMLGAAEPADRILEIGCGTGLLTAHLCRLFPRARIDAFDIAPGMVAQCRARLAGAAGLRCRVGDLQTFRKAAAYPLIASSSALHWIYPLAGAMRILSGLLADNGRLVFAIMVRGTLAELHSSRRRVAPQKRPARRLPTAASVRAALQRAGLRIEDEREDVLRQIYVSAAGMLQKLHDQGLTGGPFARSGRSLNRAELRQLAMDYEASYRAGAGVYASYRTVCFRARKDKGCALY